MPTVDSIMLEQRAAMFAKRSIKTASKTVGLRLAMSMLDLTTLEGKDSPEKVRSLCRKALRPHDEAMDPPIPSVAAVCVYPAMVPTAREILGSMLEQMHCSVAQAAGGAEALALARVTVSRRLAHGKLFPASALLVAQAEHVALTAHLLRAAGGLLAGGHGGQVARFAQR